MITHRIDFHRAVASDWVVPIYKGERLGRSIRLPLLDGARRLLRLGLAAPEDRIEVWRDGQLVMAAPIWAAAKLSVDGIYFNLWRARFGGVG